MEKDKTKSQGPCDGASEAWKNDTAAREVAAPERWITNLRLLWHKRGFVLRAVGMGLLLSTVAAFVIPKRYTTRTRLMPPDSQSTSMTMLTGIAEKAGSELGSAAGDLLGLKSSGALFVSMLQSETIQDRLVQEFELKRVYRAALLADARKKLGERTDIQEDRKSGIITITVTDESAQRAAAIANAYVNELNTMVAQLSTSSAHRERVFLEGRLQSVKQDLDGAEGQLAQFSSKNSTLDIQQQGKAMLDAAAGLSGQMIAAESELEGLRQIYTENNARVRELSARVRELRRELDKIGGVDSNLTRARQNNANASAQPAADSPAEMPYPSIRTLPLLGAKYSDYYREAKIQETVYELLTEQNELAKVEEAKETPSVKVLDLAEIPEKKSYPPRLTIVCLGMLITLVVVTIQVIGTSHWEQMGPEDDRKMFAQEVAATIRTELQWLPQNVSSLRTRTQGIFIRLRRPAEGEADLGLSSRR